jgi:hypothetical protein
VGLRLFLDNSAGSTVGSLGIDEMVRLKRWRGTAGVACPDDEVYAGPGLGLGPGDGQIDFGPGIGLLQTVFEDSGGDGCDDGDDG